MTEEKQERALGLSPAQVAGSALAAVTAATLASLAGTAGTIIGAAVGSVVATVGAAAYTWWLRRTSEAVRRKALQVRQTAILAGPIPRRVTDGPLRPGKRTKRGVPGVDADEAPDEDGDGDGPGARFVSWRKIALATAAVLVTTLGGITAVEAVTGKPLSSLLGRNDSTGTTLGNVSSGGDKQEQAPTEDRSTEDAEPDQEPEPTAETEGPEPTGDPTPTEEIVPDELGTDSPLPTPTPGSDTGTEAPEGVTGE